MQFQQGHLYHIYNQGNNRRKIFIQERNYHFFLEKLRTYICPYADILAWCLMPNHFHLMVRVNAEELVVKAQASQGKSQCDSESRRDLADARTFNDSIGIMLRSYTRAINKQESWSGSLFRESTKAECLTSVKEYRRPYFTRDGITYFNVIDPEHQYPQHCFDYIHQNPVAARIVTKATHYTFSSAKDYAGLRNGNLVSKEVALEYLNPNKQL